MKARPPLAVSTPSTSVSVPPPPTTTYVVQGQNGVVSPPNYTVSSATVAPLTTPKCAYQTLPAVQYIQHPVSNVFYFVSIAFYLCHCELVMQTNVGMDIAGNWINGCGNIGEFVMSGKRPFCTDMQCSVWCQTGLLSLLCDQTTILSVTVCHPWTST